MLGKKIFRIFSMISLVILVMLAPGQAQMVSGNNPPPTTVIYNLYATDGYIAMADGRIVYNYGFIGGRQGEQLVYQPSVNPADGTQPDNVTIPGGAPAPTGGPWTGLDEQLAGNAQFPAPLIFAKKNDVVELRLKNLGVKADPVAPNDPHSIHLHGLDVNAANDGVPETSIGAVPANMCNDGTTAVPGVPCIPAPGAGNVVVYMFTPKTPGTYMYHCHQEADIHVNMGMYGALVIYNANDQAITGRIDPATGQKVYGPGGKGTQYGFSYDKDYILLLSDLDTRGHQDEEGTYVPGPGDPESYNWAQYRPNYWFINGLSFPQTIHAGFTAGGYNYTHWIAAHPGYETLISGSVSTPNGYWGTRGEKVLIRVINMGFEAQPMHMHGFHGKILGSDQHAWGWANIPKTRFFPPTPFDQGLEKNTLLVGSGETYDWLVDFGQQSLTSTYPTNSQTRYDPATNLPVANTNKSMPAIPEFGIPGEPSYIGGPVVGPGPGDEGSIPAQILGTTIPGQLFPFHNHDDYKATNDGAYPGGMFTMLMTLP